MDLAYQVSRLSIGDTLLSPIGHRVDFLEPDMFPSCKVIGFKERTLYFNIRNSTDEILKFIFNFNWKAENMPLPPDGGWVTHREYNGDHKGWGMVRALSLPHSHRFFEQAPGTRRRRCVYTIARLSSDRGIYDDHNQVIAVESYRYRNRADQKTTGYEIQYERGGFYYVPDKTVSKHHIAGYLQIQDIVETTIGEMKSALGFLDEGHSTWRSFATEWSHKRQNGLTVPKKPVWRLHIAPVLTEFEPPVTIQQPALL